MLAKNYACGATGGDGGDYLIVYVQDSCVGCRNSSSCITVLYSLIAMSYIERSNMIFKSCKVWYSDL